jgi:cytidine deaminase
VAKNRRAYYKVRRKTSKLTVTIIRDNGYHSQLQSSQPCIFCQQLLKKYKFKKIIYTEDGGKISVKRHHQLESTHYSRAQRVTMSTVKDITHPKMDDKELFTHKKVKKKSSKKY